MMRRPCARLLGILVVLVLVLVLATAGPTSAQDATPAASPIAGAGPQVGDAVLLFSNNGREQAQIAVAQLVDPFDEVESDAQRGYHYVMLEVVVENLSDSAYDFNPYIVSLVDAEGFIYTGTYASRPSEAVAAQPDFQAGTIEPGQTASGVLFFEVIDDAAVELVVASDSYQQFAILVDQRSDVPAEGESLPIYDSGADEIGAISVDQIITGLEETDPTLTVERGQTIVAVVITASNTGDVPLVSPGASLRVVDEFGFVSYATYASRGDESLAQLPDFPSDDIAPGDSATGAVLFALPADAVVTYVLYQADYARLTLVGQPGEGSVVSGDELEPVAVPTEEAVDEPTDEPIEDEPIEDETPVALTGDCADLQNWADATGENFATLDEIDIFGTDELDADDLREAADTLREAGVVQADIDTPEIAQDGQDAIIVLIEAYADLLEQGADDLDDGVDSSELFATSFTEGPFVDAFTEFTAVATELQAACPDVDFGDLA